MTYEQYHDDPVEQEEDAYVQFCIDNELDPDSITAQRRWVEQIEDLNLAPEEP